MLGKEPVWVFVILAVILQAAVIFFTDNPGIGPDWILPALTLAAGFLARRKVFSEATVRSAGFTPDEFQIRADSPSIREAVGE